MKVRGVRVSTQVVEQAIQEHPDVIEVAVIAGARRDRREASCTRSSVRRRISKFNGMTLRKHLIGQARADGDAGLDRDRDRAAAEDVDRKESIGSEISRHQRTSKVAG